MPETRILSLFSTVQALRQSEDICLLMTTREVAKSPLSCRDFSSPHLSSPQKAVRPTPSQYGTEEIAKSSSIHRKSDLLPELCDDDVGNGIWSGILLLAMALASVSAIVMALCFSWRWGLATFPIVEVVSVAFLFYLVFGT